MKPKLKLLASYFRKHVCEMSSTASVEIQAAITCTRVQTATVVALAITFVVEKLLLDFTMSDNEPHDNIRLENETKVTNAFFFRVQFDLVAREGSSVLQLATTQRVEIPLSSRNTN